MCIRDRSHSMADSFESGHFARISSEDSDSDDDEGLLRDVAGLYNSSWHGTRRKQLALYLQKRGLKPSKVRKPKRGGWAARRSSVVSDTHRGESGEGSEQFDPVLEAWCAELEPGAPLQHTPPQGTSLLGCQDPLRDPLRQELIRRDLCHNSLWTPCSEWTSA
eukprot:TRINITY_DN15409_c0_g1_i1.p1 TRINITY_DN15409_c0_g1~~TRINITY_DN15409_c0_g1_i1.p1  ORF type:complete len:163 (-),score=31.61 TRINITY_DN15409_c0_g1_i1:176-664(-)